MRKAIIGLAFCVIGPSQSHLQGYPSLFTPGVATRAVVTRALEYIDRNRDRQLEEWIRITEISSPSGQESKRASYIKAQMEAAGLVEVHIDEIGNCVGLRKGTGGGPTLVLAAHMDTVHPIDTPIKVRRDGGTLHAPGVFDNSASCADLLWALRAMNAVGVRTKGDVIFIGTVQEETGLRGMRHWLERNKTRADMLVAVDGPLGDVYYGALGVKWYKYIYSCSGSHTMTSRGRPNPARAVAQAIQKIYSISLPAQNGQSFGVYSVGMIGGGKVFNATPESAFFTIDVRANNEELLDGLISQINQCAEDAAKIQQVQLRVEKSQDGAASITAKDYENRRAHPIVQTAVDVITYLGANKGQAVQALPWGSTDANVGVYMGIPSIAVGRSFGDRQHSLDEWADIDSAFLGTKQIILLTVSLAGLAAD
jgi:tripeptide aminopeptidase